MEDKICPVMSKWDRVRENLSEVPCIGLKCAWYNTAKKACRKVMP